MTAPEKIYLFDNPLIDFTKLSIRQGSDDIEYTRTDVFIEKAVKWIEETNNHHYIMSYSGSCEPPLSELIEWFKNYMKGE